MRWVLSMTLLLLTANAHAERLYISDKLVVSAYAEASQESERLASLESGDAVESLDREEDYTRVKLADGREGWIKSTYLTSQPPARLRVKELEKERAASASTSGTVTEELKRLREQNVALSAELEELKRTASRPTSTVAQAASRVETDDPALGRWATWGAAAILAVGALGFTLGHRSVTRRIQRKYGKLKIY
jgi:uncharacterized protein YgiM (DUF1202 family)